MIEKYFTNKSNQQVHVLSDDEVSKQIAELLNLKEISKEKAEELSTDLLDNLKDDR